MVRREAADAEVLEPGGLGEEAHGAVKLHVHHAKVPHRLVPSVNRSVVVQMLGRWVDTLDTFCSENRLKQSGWNGSFTNLQSSLAPQNSTYLASCVMLAFDSLSAPILTHLTASLTHVMSVRLSGRTI